MERSEIIEKLTEYMAEMFELDPERIVPEAKLYEDLDLDSIDAVDLVVKLQEMTGRKIKPDQFKTVRTVQDVVDRVHELLA